MLPLNSNAHLNLYIYLSNYVYIYLFNYVYIYLSIYLSIYLKSASYCPVLPVVWSVDACFCAFWSPFNIF